MVDVHRFQTNAHIIDKLALEAQTESKRSLAKTAQTNIKLRDKCHTSCHLTSLLQLRMMSLFDVLVGENLLQRPRQKHDYLMWMCHFECFHLHNNMNKWQGKLNYWAKLTDTTSVCRKHLAVNHVETDHVAPVKLKSIIVKVCFLL